LIEKIWKIEINRKDLKKDIIMVMAIEFNSISLVNLTKLSKSMTLSIFIA